jgi:hypothetical protein
MICGILLDRVNQERLSFLSDRILITDKVTVTATAGG